MECYYIIFAQNEIAKNWKNFLSNFYENVNFYEKT